MGRIIPYIMGNKKCLKPPASISGMWGYGYGIHDDTTERLFLSLSVAIRWWWCPCDVLHPPIPLGEWHFGTKELNMQETILSSDFFWKKHMLRVQHICYHGFLVFPLQIQGSFPTGQRPRLNHSTNFALLPPSWRLAWVSPNVPPNGWRWQTRLAHLGTI